jgi:hypothetical protein
MRTLCPKGETKMNINTITNAVGVIGAVALSTQPVLNAVQGSLHQGDWIALIMAVVTAISNYFIGKEAK